MLSDTLCDCKVDAQPDRKSFGKGSFQNARHLQLAIKRHKPDFVYVPTADGIIQCYGWLRLLSGQFRRQPYQLEMLVMGGHRTLSQPVNLKASMKRRWSITGIENSGCTTLHTLDSILHRLLARSERLQGRIRTIPEANTDIAPVSKSEARRRLGLSADDRLIGFFGRQGSRKGFDLLLDAFFKSKAQLPGTKLLLMGQTDPTTETMLSRYLANPITAQLILLSKRIRQPGADDIRDLRSGCR